MRPGAAPSDSVVFATCAEFPALPPEDRVTMQALERRQIASSVRIWREASEWSDHPSLVVIRSCWDYHHHLDEFLDWITALTAGGVRVANPPRLIRWNARKRYLLELQDAGLPIGIPTLLVGRQESTSPEESLARAIASGQFSWDDIVVKPEVSGQAWETYRLHPLDSHADLDSLRALISTRHCIIQPFVPDILTEGELSLIFFGGSFSHAVQKVAAPGEYRVQEVYGGTVHRAVPNGQQLEFATRALATVADVAGVPLGSISYARIDVVNALPLRLMEVEVIEPSLFLDFSADAADRFAQVIEDALQG